MAHDRILTETELRIILGVVIALHAEMGAGTVPSRLAKRIAALFSASAFPFDLGKYMDEETASHLAATLSPDALRANLGLMRLTQRLHYATGQAGSPDELAQPIE